MQLTRTQHDTRRYLTREIHISDTALYLSAKSPSTYRPQQSTHTLIVNMLSIVQHVNTHVAPAREVWRFSLNLEEGWTAPNGQCGYQ